MTHSKGVTSQHDTLVQLLSSAAMSSNFAELTAITHRSAASNAGEPATNVPVNVTSNVTGTRHSYRN
jgi:hypothetical protein